MLWDDIGSQAIPIAGFLNRIFYSYANNGLRKYSSIICKIEIYSGASAVEERGEMRKTRPNVRLGVTVRSVDGTVT